VSDIAIRAFYNTAVCFEGNFMVGLFNMESEPTEHNSNVPSREVPERIVKPATSYVRYCTRLISVITTERRVAHQLKDTLIFT
jgi:hypothetical protein